MTITIYHNPRCSKSRAALALLKERGIEARIVEYLKTPPSAGEFRRILGLLGEKPRTLLRAKEAREEGLDDAVPDDDALITWMVTHPVAIERPIVVTDTAARLAQPPERLLEIL
jgi:arsenate reductase